MIKFKTFKQALHHIKRIDITGNGETFSVKKAFFDKKTNNFLFIGDGGEIKLSINQKNIFLISRILTDDDNEFLFNVFLRNDKHYIMEFHMREGYSFFVNDKYTRENIKSVYNAVPRYLNPLKGKKIEIKQALPNEAFTTWNDMEYGEDNRVFCSFTIYDFDYELSLKSGLVVVDFVDKFKSDTVRSASASAVDTTFIIGDISDKVIIGTDCCEYVLKVVD